MKTLVSGSFCWNHGGLDNINALMLQEIALEKRHRTQQEALATYYSTLKTIVSDFFCWNHGGFDYIIALLLIAPEKRHRRVSYFGRIQLT